jgi:RNase P/RNase MRP subunit p30
MTKFTDLELRIPLDNEKISQKMIEKASELKYKSVALPFPPRLKKEKIKQFEKICKNEKIDFASRTNLFPQNPKELLHELRQYRRKFEIISVRCNTKEIARQAAKDRRVDILQFSLTNLRKRFFDKQEAKLAKEAFSALEIEVAPIFQLTSFSRIKLLSCLQKEVKIAQKEKVPIILSSGATNDTLMKGPYEYASFSVLFDLPFSLALNSISKTPFELIQRNREKLDQNYIAPGIHLIGRKTHG